MFLFEFYIFGDGIKFSGVGFDDVCLRDSTGRTVEGIETVFGDFGIFNEFAFVEKVEAKRSLGVLYKGSTEHRHKTYCDDNQI